MSVRRQIRAAGWALAAALGLQACGGGGIGRRALAGRRQQQ
ncbi:hypothetical protein PEC18_26560 [Paucibacter sp. O1-1]|nr:hypothetical protein [Paucibacter sp. O1-1]MDA3829303.1 hypothetical protein [Paucibacter sp. O1-1]